MENEFPLLNGDYHRASYLKIGERRFINQYEVLEAIGNGLYSMVHRAVDMNTGITYAMKVYPLTVLEGKRACIFTNKQIQMITELDKLLKDIRIQSRLEKLKSHSFPKTIEIIQDCTYNNLLVVQEFFEGGTLLVWDQQNEAYHYPPSHLPSTSPSFHTELSYVYSEQVAKKVMKALIQALLLLHKEGIVHKDLKPENVLLRREWGEEEKNVLFPKPIEKEERHLMGSAWPCAPVFSCGASDEEEEEESSDDEPSPQNKRRRAPLDREMGDWLWREGVHLHPDSHILLPDGSYSAVVMEHFRKFSPSEGDSETGDSERDDERGDGERGEEKLLAIIDFNTSQETNGDMAIYDAEGTQLFTPPECFLPRTEQELMEDIRRPLNGNKRDVWSLGVILFTMLYGQCIYSAESNLELQLKIIQEEVVYPGWRELSKECHSFLQWVLEKNPEKRPSSEELLKHEWFSGTLHRE